MEWCCALRYGAVCRGLQPDVVTFNALISVCERSERWAQALVHFNEMRSCRLDPTSASLSSVLSACRRASAWSLAMHFLQGHRSAANIVAFNAGLSALERGSQWEQALWLLASLPRGRGSAWGGGDGGGVNLRPDVLSFTAAAVACGKSGRWGDAAALLASMRGGSVDPDLMTCAAVLDVCRDALAMDSFRRLQASSKSSL
mmetsp:Transcript_48339/g.155055  ORF Transcript_48339/g.155055 Transcript_48339/m.155055 type:complete len:201 (-) Transcript_48339:389-991(-)